MKPPVLTTSRLTLTHISTATAEQVAEFFARNHTHLAETNPLPLPQTMSVEFWETRIHQARQDLAQDTAIRFVARLHGRDSIAGMTSLTQIARGPFQACYLGFAIDQEFQGKGLMFEAVDCVIQFAFNELNLHRVMANHLVTNNRSAALLKRLGFETEGLAKNYLRLNGEWRDHVLTSLINPNWKPTSPT